MRGSAGIEREALLIRMEKLFRMAFFILVELGLLYADVIAAIGFSVFNNEPASSMEKLSLLLMCICDPISFGLSWFKPKYAGLLLAITSGITLALSLAASDRHSLKALWFSGGLFWGMKFVLSYLFYRKGAGRLAFDGSAADVI
jgi:hypothetical protein